MKKIISLALAAAMVAGMAVTSFATTTRERLVMGEMEDADNLTQEVLYKISDSKVLEGENIFSVPVKPGTTLSIPLAVAEETLDKDGKVTATKYKKVGSKDIKSYKVKATWEANTGDIVDTIKIESRKNNVTTSIEDSYDYYIVITTKKDYGTNSHDLYGKLELYKTSIKNADVLSFNYNTAGYTSESISSNNVVEADDSAPVRTFDDVEDEIEIEFDGVGIYEVNAKDQNDLYLSFTTKLDEDVANTYDYANLDFVNFPGTPKFYRTGVFYLYADIEEDKYLYQLVNGVVSDVDYAYDDEMEAFKFALKNFPNSFIISDVELDLEEVAVDVPTTEAPDAETPSKENPNTGR